MEGGAEENSEKVPGEDGNLESTAGDGRKGR